MRAEEVLAVPIPALRAWLAELVLLGAVVLGFVTAGWRSGRAARPVMVAGATAAAVLAVVTWPEGAVQPLGPHWTVDRTAALVRVAILAATALTVLNLPDRGGRGGVLLGVAALGLIGLAQAATVGALLLAVAAYVVGACLAAWFLCPPGGRPAVRRWHATATLGFALAAAGAALWSGLTGSLDLASGLAALVVRPHLPPQALPLVLGCLGAGLVLALLGEPGRFASGAGEDRETERGELPAVVTGWLTAAPPLGLVAMLHRLLQATPPARPLGVVPELLTMAAALLMLGGMLAALAQRDLDRRLAWAATGQVGLAFCGLSAVTATGVAATAQPAVFLLLVFAAAQLGACLLVETTRALDAQSRRRQLLPFLMAGMLLALAALPPLAGWQPRVQLLQALLVGDRYLGAGLVLLGTLLGCFVYLRPLVDLWGQDATAGARPSDAAAAAVVEPAWPVVALLSAAALLGVLLAWGLGSLGLPVGLPAR